ncbi:MAG TPA: alpha-amylase family glycosyl hydrolase [Chitinophagaceae bacterium]|nr:alpha-amylase family glycosyl hydrolase [Chitinophagaceae bacterium]
MKVCIKTFLALGFLALFSCKNSTNSNTATTADDSTSVDSNKVVSAAPPAWSLQSNIYEVNLRQYGKNNTFQLFANEFPRLREMGVEILWFMPITPISKVDRKGTLGSYYAVQNYRTVNPEYGTMDDWKALVQKAHDAGFKVITDWVPNHSGADHPWLQSNPEFYVKDSTGKPLAPNGWTDVRKLNYENLSLRDSMVASMKFWITETGIDGFRCDVAGDVPSDFWKDCIAELRRTKELFMLAEADKIELHTVGFNATYPWSIENILYGVYSGKTKMSQVDSAIEAQDKQLPADAMRMYFTTNHDENSWNATEFERFGNGAKAFAVWTATMKRSIPLIYSGQEAGNKKRLQFFEKDPIQWGNYSFAKFYRALLTTRTNTPALAADASFKKVSAGDSSLYAFVREKNGSKVAVILNLSPEARTVVINDDQLIGEPMNIFLGVKEKLDKGHSFGIEQWGYVIFKY